MSNKTVYIAMSADVVHAGHINVINKGAEYGDVIIGLLTDEAIGTYKRLPILDYQQRLAIFSNIKGVTRVVEQKTLDYTDNLLALKPDYVIHGDDWREGVQKLVREKVIATLATYGGQLVEIPYTKGVSSTDAAEKYRMLQTTPDSRRAKLRKLLAVKPYITAIDTSSGLNGIIVEKTKYVDEATSTTRQFDAMWISSLCDSTFKGKPDIELVDQTSRLNTINEIMEVTTKPIILDGDTGGQIDHFAFNVKTYERVGISAVIIEDKTGAKRNSLFGTDVKQTLDDPDHFAEKIHAGKQAQVTRDFMIIARLESLIAGYGVDDAMMRARKYIAAGADGIMIHSKEKTGEDIFAFMKEFRAFSKDIPLVLVPTTYNQFTNQQLADHGANIIIYANQLLRSAYPAMVNCATSILQHQRSTEAAAEYCMPVKEILTLIPGGK